MWTKILWNQNPSRRKLSRQYASIERKTQNPLKLNVNYTAIIIKTIYLRVGLVIDSQLNLLK